MASSNVEKAATAETVSGSLESRLASTAYRHKTAGFSRQLDGIPYATLADLCRAGGTRDCPCPLCGPDRRHAANRKRKVLRVWHLEPGFASYSCARCGAKGWARVDDRQKVEPRRWPVAAEATSAGTISPTQIDAALAERVEYALRLWGESKPLTGTLGWKYFTERRGLHIGLIDDLSHCLRWHDGITAVIGLMTDPVTAVPTGIHRTLLNRDGTKRERKMLGKQGVVRLSPDADVTLGLGITEGIENGLAVLLMGWSPVWAATCAGGIDRFPALPRIKRLTIFSDADEIGIKAAKACAERWRAAGRRASITLPKDIV